MFSKFRHTGEVATQDELLFTTPFGYMFPDAAHSASHLLPESPETLTALRQLGDAMASDVIAAPNDSDIPAMFTYLGQFIDHDLTARTDRESATSTLGRGEPVTPRDPDEVVAHLRNGRRPQFDLDSVFGDGPSLAQGSETESDTLYTPDFHLHVFNPTATRRDVPRGPSRGAVIADGRNDENPNISALHCAFLLLYNKIYDAQVAGTPACKHIRARQLTRWAYQYVVVQDYLPTVCDQAIVIDTLVNGPRYYGNTAGHGQNFMPLEFSTAAFRFGHTMIRPEYRLQTTEPTISVMDLLGPSRPDVNGDPIGTFFDTTDAVPHQLRDSAILDFTLFAGTGPNVQMARKIDSNIARGLGMLPLGDRQGDPILGHLAKSNLIRGYSLSVPTGQACCEAMGVKPMSRKDMADGESADVAAVLTDTALGQRTPLWYYILREAGAQAGGNHLGELGSRIVCETIVGSLKTDPNSYLNANDLAVTPLGINVGGAVISTLTELLNHAGVGPVA
ncbi:heme peroxidase family protein [Gordonia sp. PKS22-38]|uniref:Heme peroxidase family protein n=1 Tax=Gordonia prachuapensis TaxID=3115651 RepID=A0ABU7MWC6_9ACTN|nr:heme peroxidase family protein [Gordonia sp. PKS22-38]